MDRGLELPVATLDIDLAGRHRRGGLRRRGFGLCWYCGGDRAVLRRSGDGRVDVALATKRIRQDHRAGGPASAYLRARHDTLEVPFSDTDAEPTHTDASGSSLSLTLTLCTGSYGGTSLGGTCAGG